MLRMALGAGVLGLTVLLSTRSPVAEETCFPDWSLAAPIVKQRGLVTVEQLSKLARHELSAEIVKATLCEEKGGFVFRLVVRGTNGQLKSVTVDAKAPFGR
jgi:uncharacterized membrane protein YkoI